MLEKRTVTWAFALALILAVGCGQSGEESSPPAPDASVDTGSEDTNPLTCPPGQAIGPGGDCAVAGPQDCVAEFIDPDTGLCAPRVNSCPLGQVAVMDEGCAPVGISGCGEVHIDPDTGLCDPDPDACEPGFIPLMAGGCQRVGIPSCHPDFWLEDEGRCEPHAALCADHEIPHPTQGCISLDPPGGCGEGTWGNIEALPGDVHVDPSYEGGDSDGSRDKPYTTVLKAYWQADDGARVVLAAGHYVEGIMFNKPLSLVGRCASMVTLSGTHQMGAFGVTLVSEFPVDVYISDVRLAGPGIGVVALLDSHIVAERVHFDHVVTIAAWASNRGHLTLRSCLIENTQPNTMGGGGNALQVDKEGNLVVEGSLVVGNRELGLLTDTTEVHVELRDTVIEATQLSAEGKWGDGLVSQGGTLLVEGCAVLDNHTSGIYVNGGATASVVDSVVTGTVSGSDGILGAGIYVATGAQVTVTRSDIAENEGIALRVWDPGSSLTAGRSLVRHTWTNAYSTSGFAAWASEGALFVATQSTFVDNHGGGLKFTDPGTRGSLDQCIVSRTHEGLSSWWETPNPGRPLQVGFNAELEVSRSAIRDGGEIGLLVFSAGQATVAQSLVTAIRQYQEKSGYAVHVQDGGQLSLERSAIHAVHGVGLMVAGEGSQLSVDRSLVSDVSSGATSVGAGMVAAMGGALTVGRTTVRGTQVAGIFAHQGTVHVEETIVGRALGLGDDYGDGILCQESTIHGTRVIAADNRRAGFFLDVLSTGTLDASLAVDNAYGLVAAPEGGIELAPDSAMIGNEDDYLFGGELEIPDAPTEIPVPYEVGG